MKTKITLLIGFLSLILSQADAFTVTIQGGGRNQRFDYVNCSRYALVCRGNGSNVCPIIWEIGLQKGVRYPISEIVDYVSKLIQRGEKSGSSMYKEAVPVKWQSIENGMQIDIDVEEVITEEHD